MELRPTTRYPSVGMSGNEPDRAGPVSVDGLEVVDEQVVVLTPLDRPGARRRPGREDRHAVG